MPISLCTNWHIKGKMYAKWFEYYTAWIWTNFRIVPLLLCSVCIVTAVSSHSDRTNGSYVSILWRMPDKSGELSQCHWNRSDDDGLLLFCHCMWMCESIVIVTDLQRIQWKNMSKPNLIFEKKSDTNEAHIPMHIVINTLDVKTKQKRSGNSSSECNSKREEVIKNIHNDKKITLRCRFFPSP